jgi:hypothetical protein
LGNGKRTSFWIDVWLDTSVLKELFLLLLLLAVDKNGTVAESGCWCGLSWKWNICWSRTLLDREAGEVSMLQDIIVGISLVINTPYY